MAPVQRRMVRRLAAAHASPMDENARIAGTAKAARTAPVKGIKDPHRRRRAATRDSAQTKLNRLCERVRQLMHR
jgi:hypothetical protein